MVISLRSAVGIATIWLAAVAGVSATAWFAIDRAGRDITNVSVTTLPPGPLNPPTMATEPQKTTVTPTTSATAPPAATPAPSPAPAPTGAAEPAPSPAPVAPKPRDLTIRVEGGVFTVRCTGADIGLRSAQPQNDWQVHVDTPSSGQIVVSFRTGDDEERRSTKVTAVCTDGTPVFSVSNG